MAAPGHERTLRAPVGHARLRVSSGEFPLRGDAPGYSFSRSSNTATALAHEPAVASLRERSSLMKSRNPCAAPPRRRNSNSAPASQVNAAMQASRQRRHHDANPTWLEPRQQFDEGAPALDSLISGDVPAHGARIGNCTRAGKPLGEPGQMPPRRRVRGGSRDELRKPPRRRRKGASAVGLAPN